MNEAHSYVDVLLNACNLLKCVRDRVKDGDSTESGDFYSSDFWNMMTQAVSSTSQEATKLSLAFSKPPLPSEQDFLQLVGGLQTSSSALAELSHRLPKSQGTTLRRVVREAVMEVLDGVLGLLEVLRSSPVPSLGRDQMMCTGGVWAACDRFIDLPRDNRAAAARLTASRVHLVKDALHELEQALDGGGDPFGDVPDDDDDGVRRSNRDTYWSPSDRQLVSRCVGMVKVAGACLRKLTTALGRDGEVVTPGNAAQLDDLAEAAQDISPSVDELVMSLYPPVEPPAVEQNVCELASILKRTLGRVRACYVCSEADVRWVEFLEGAADHNLLEVKTLLSQG